MKTVKTLKNKFLTANMLFLFSCLLASGCSKATYTEQNIISSMKDICLKEYKVENVDVKIAGKTIGVFLPLERLFESDIKKMILSGKTTNLDSLFVPLPAAMDKLNDVLFTTSRVVLSTDMDLRFYQLYVSDVESTGLQIVLTGYIPDLSRMRMWDIPHSEYRKRVLHDLKLNRAVLWEKPIRTLFRDAENLGTFETLSGHFSEPPKPVTVSPLFYSFLTELEYKKNLRINLQAVKSRAYFGNQGLIYIKMAETYVPKEGANPSVFSYPSGAQLEYIFIVDMIDDTFKITQVIPLYYVDEARQLKKISFPKELDLYQNLESWQDHFEIEDINIGEFLATQLSRRTQNILAEDERIRNTMQAAQVDFSYHHNTKESGPIGKGPYFSVKMDFEPKSAAGNTNEKGTGKISHHEDVDYVTYLVLREFVDVMRSYQFSGYEYVEFTPLNEGLSTSLGLSLENLELFRKKRLDIKGLLATGFTL